MKYKVGDFLTMEHSVFLMVVCAMPGDNEVYGLRSIKRPTDLTWYTLTELDHEGYALQTPCDFSNALVGDLVATGGKDVCKVLARIDRAILLSKAKGGRGMPPILELVGALGGELEPEMEEHLHVHDTTKYNQNAADDWYDIEVMSLMNWQLVRE